MSEDSPTVRKYGSPTPREPWGIAQAEKSLRILNQSLISIERLIATMHSIRPHLPDRHILAPDSQHWCLEVAYLNSLDTLRHAQTSMQHFHCNLQQERDKEATLARRR